MKPVNAIDIFRHALSVYARNAATVLMTSLLINGIALVTAVVALNALHSAGLFVLVGITMLSTQVTIGASAIINAGIDRDGEPPSPGDVAKVAFASSGQLTIVALLYALGVILGIVCFVIPGLYLAVRWCLAPVAVVLRRAGISESFRISSTLTAQAMGTAFFVNVLTGLVMYGLPRLINGNSSDDMAPLETSMFIAFALNALTVPVAGLAFSELFLRLAPLSCLRARRASAARDPGSAHPRTWRAAPRTAAGSPRLR